MSTHLLSDSPSDEVAELKALQAKPDHVVPAKGDNLLIGTWNVRNVDRGTEKWRSVSGDSPIRDLSNVLCIPETCGASTWPRSRRPG